MATYSIFIQKFIEAIEASRMHINGAHSVRKNCFRDTQENLEGIEKVLTRDAYAGGGAGGQLPLLPFPRT